MINVIHSRFDDRVPCILVEASGLATEGARATCLKISLPANFAQICVDAIGRGNSLLAHQISASTVKCKVIVRSGAAANRYNEKTKKNCLTGSRNESSPKVEYSKQ